MRTRLVLVGCLAMVTLGGTRAHILTPAETCVAKGLDYHRNSGQHPTVSTGISAEYMAREHCSRSAAAFDVTT